MHVDCEVMLNGGVGAVIVNVTVLLELYCRVNLHKFLELPIPVHCDSDTFMLVLALLSVPAPHENKIIAIKKINIRLKKCFSFSTF